MPLCRFAFLFFFYFRFVLFQIDLSEAVSSFSFFFRAFFYFSEVKLGAPTFTASAYSTREPERYTMYVGVAIVGRSEV